MKIAKANILSTVRTVNASPPSHRTTQQTFKILTFIHRFRHVTSRHMQLSLRHAHVNSTLSQLARLRAKGYIARRYDTHDRAANRAASYFLTPEGLRLLQAHYPERQYRRTRSLLADATMGIRSRERYHTLADVYAHFKRHYDGKFEFFSAFDIAGLDCMPDEVPDGYVRVTLPGSGIQHYFIEIHGWNRSTQAQQRRLHSYIHFAESERWPKASAEPIPHLFIVAASPRSQKRIQAQATRLLAASMAQGFQIYATTAAKLDSDVSTIWRRA